MIFKSKKVKRLEAEVAEVTASLQKFAAALSDTQAVLKMNLQDCVSVSRKRDVRGGVKLSFSFKKDEWAAIMSDGYALHLAAEHVIAGLMVEFEDKATRLRADGKYVLKFSLSSVPVKGQLCNRRLRLHTACRKCCGVR